jgi:hypothetical protein
MMMICYLWHGWTTAANADAYEARIRAEVIPGMLSSEIAGFHRLEFLRNPVGDYVEFMSVLWFASQAAMQEYVGDMWRHDLVPGCARALQSRFERPEQSEPPAPLA